MKSVCDNMAYQAACNNSTKSECSLLEKSASSSSSDENLLSDTARSLKYLQLNIISILYAFEI